MLGFFKLVRKRSSFSDYLLCPPSQVSGVSLALRRRRKYIIMKKTNLVLAVFITLVTKVAVAAPFPITVDANLLIMNVAEKIKLRVDAAVMRPDLMDQSKLDVCTHVGAIIADADLLSSIVGNSLGGPMQNQITQIRVDTAAMESVCTVNSIGAGDSVSVVPILSDLNKVRGDAQKLSDLVYTRTN